MGIPQKIGTADRIGGERELKSELRATSLWRRLQSSDTHAGFAREHRGWRNTGTRSWENNYLIGVLKFILFLNIERIVQEHVR